MFGRRPVSLDLVAGILSFAHSDRAAFDYPSRAFPSAGGLYGTEAYLIAKRVDGLTPGVYHYSPQDHVLHVLSQQTDAHTVNIEGFNQHVGTPAAFFVESARLGPTINKYGLRGFRFALMEVGAAAEVLDLTATALGLATLWLGGFVDDDLWRSLGVSPVHDIEVPLLVVAIGYPKVSQARHPAGAGQSPDRR
jgi:SagB-type dehydrogenase family enzyme